jgi:TonB family protein
MKINFILLLIFCIPLFVKPQSKSNNPIALTDIGYYFIQNKVLNVNYKTCTTEEILNFITLTENKQSNPDINNYAISNEFEKHKIINKLRDSLVVYNNLFLLEKVYTYSSTRLLGDYSFKESYYPILNPAPDIMLSAQQQEKERNKIFHKTPYRGMILINGNSFPLSINLKPDSAESILKLKQRNKSKQEQLMDTRTIYNDGLGNKVSGNDKRIFIKYYIVFGKANNNSENLDKSTNPVTAKIVKLEYYIDVECQKKVYSSESVSSQLKTADRPKDKDLTDDTLFIQNASKKLVKVDEPIDTFLYSKVDTEASFPGGDQQWGKYLTEHFIYPQEAQDNAIEGTVTIQFIVDKDGSLSDIKAIDGPTGGDLRATAIKLIARSGKWNPGVNNGHVVKSYKKQPFTFRLGSN